MILVSVIIPYFKKKEFIKKAVDSVISQTHKNLEIIIVYDDEDPTDLALIKKIKDCDKRINIIVNKKSLGAGESRNLGIKKAKADYIAFLDADDFWRKNKIELQLKFMVNNKLNITHTSYEILRKNQYRKKIMKAKNFLTFEKLLLSCDIGLSTVMLNKRILSKKCKFPKIKTKEDFVLWLLIMKKNIKIFGLNKNLTTWRKLNNSLSSSIIQKLQDGLKVYRIYMKFNIFKSFFYLLILSVNSLIK